MTTPEPHSVKPENSNQEAAPHNALEAAGIDAAAVTYPHNPDFDNGRWFPTWRPYSGDLDRDPVGINEYLPPAKSVLLGVQHTFAMFGATVLAPLLMGFDPNLAILMSGICTVMFFIITGGRMPSYLGSSFAFIGPVIAVTAYAGVGFNDNLNVALGGIMACGIIYALIGLVVNTISGLSVKELPEEELNSGIENDEEKKYGLVQAFKLLVKNKYYMMICGTYILQQLYSAMIGAGIYYCTWVLKNKNLFGVFAWAVNIPLIIALIFTPTLVGKWKGMYKLNKRGYILATIARALVIVAGYMGIVPLMMLFTAVAALGQGPWQGDMNAVIAECSEYTYLTQGKRIDGTMYSCTSLGIKIGGGIGTAIVGWLLEISGYVGTNATQPTSAITMLQVMYLWLPFVFEILITILLSKMNVEAANEKLRREKGIE